MIEERTGDKGPHRPSPSTALANTLSERLGMVHADCCVIWPSKQGPYTQPRAAVMGLCQEHSSLLFDAPSGQSQSHPLALVHCCLELDLDIAVCVGGAWSQTQCLAIAKGGAVHSQ